MDFIDLNKACPKDRFPLSQIDIIIDATTGYRVLSFIDTYSGYNPICMNQSDEEKTAFITDTGIYLAKFAFRVDSGKSLGFIISKKGIEANAEKIGAILNMKQPQNINDT